MKFLLLSKGTTNAKLVKNVMESYILYLSPHTQNDRGINICPRASPGCAAGCLFTAGRGVMRPVREARKRKTEWMLSDRQGFYRQLISELDYLQWKAVTRKIKIAVRLNGTSDVDHFKFIGPRKAGDEKSSISMYDHLLFYDYTKMPERIEKYRGSAYDLTFSRSETNGDECIKVLENGGKVAVVFATKDMPETYHGWPVINGDLTDERFQDKGGIIVGLYAKGRARQDTSGFVIKYKSNETGTIKAEYDMSGDSP